MKLFLISQTAVGGYDTYDSAVVVAHSSTEAANMRPFDGAPIQNNDRTWAIFPEDVSVRYLGEAVGFDEPQVICASFNAG